MPAPATRRLFATAVIALTAVACLQDFGTFEGGDAPDADASSVTSNDSGPTRPPDATPDVAEPCVTAPLKCLTDRTKCRLDCGTTATRCLDRCGGSDSCRDGCRDDLNACNGACNLTCATCSGTCQVGCT